MRRKTTLYITVSLLAGVLIGLAASILTEGYKSAGPSDPNQNNRSASSPPPDANGVTVSKNSQARAAIEVVPLVAMSYRSTTRAYGTVIGMQELTESRNAVVSARAKLEQANANLAASQENYARQQSLYKDDQSASQKSLQEAQALWESDKAAASAAETALSSQEAVIDQRWGQTIAKWLKNNSESFVRLVEQKDVLIQITVPRGTTIPSASENALIETVDAATVKATFISVSPRTDQRIQGLSFFYLAPKETASLLTQMNVLAYLPGHSETAGVYIPDSAVVRWHGKSYIYLQTSADFFVRRQISTQTLVKSGWFVEKGLSAGQWCVVRGAQLLLSQESRGKGNGGGED